MKLSETKSGNTAITVAQEGKKLRNLCSLVFGKYSELPKGLSITMYFIGNSIDFPFTESTCLNKVAEQGTASVDRQASLPTPSRKLGYGTESH